MSRSAARQPTYRPAQNLAGALVIAGWALLLLSPLMAFTALVGPPEPGQAVAAGGVGALFTFAGQLLKRPHR